MLKKIQIIITSCILIIDIKMGKSWFLLWLNRHEQRLLELTREIMLERERERESAKSSLEMTFNEFGLISSL